MSAVWLALSGAGVVYCLMTLALWNRERRERVAARKALTQRLSRFYEAVLDPAGRCSQDPDLVATAAAAVLASDEPDIAREASAFLAGRYQGHRVPDRRSVPAWAWINPLAHGTLADVEALAARAPDATGPEAITAAIAVQIASVVRRGLLRLEDVQRQTLLPLEEHLTATRLPAAAGEEEAARMLVAAIVESPVLPPGDIG